MQKGSMLEIIKKGNLIKLYRHLDIHVVKKKAQAKVEFAHDSS